jgi:hypothetical protein
VEELTPSSISNGVIFSLDPADPAMKQLCDNASGVHLPSLRAILLLNLWAGLLLYAAVQGWLLN